MYTVFIFRNTYLRFAVPRLVLARFGGTPSFIKSQSKMTAIVDSVQSVLRNITHIFNSVVKNVFDSRDFSGSESVAVMRSLDACICWCR
jgi:hypothetical protein